MARASALLIESSHKQEAPDPVSVDACKLAFGVSAREGPLALLGLSSSRCTRIEVVRAYERRLSQLKKNRSLSSDHRAEVDRALQSAVRALHDPIRTARSAAVQTSGRPQTRAKSEKQSLPRRVEPQERSLPRPSTPLLRTNRRPVIQLTEFDRQVLGVLVGSGGWNTSSRARLVSLASEHGVTVGGLLKVISGLSQYARSGGQRLGVADITAGASRLEPGESPTRQRNADVKQVAQRLAPELTRDDPWSTAKLAVLFAAIVLLVGTFVYRVMLRPEHSERSHELSSTVHRPEHGMIPEKKTVETTHGRVPVDQDAIAHAARYPTFRIDQLPEEAVEAFDRSADALQIFETIARKIEIADTPNEIVYRDWQYAVDAVRSSWVLQDDSRHESIRTAIIEVFVATAGREDMYRKLMESLALMRFRPREPLSIWRESWQAGMLAQISANDLVNVRIRDAALHEFSRVLRAENTSRNAFAAGVTAWLEHAVTPVATVTNTSDRTYEHWDAWLRALNATANQDAAQRTLLRAVAAVLEEHEALDRDTPAADVLGRLIAAINLSGDPVLQQQFASIYEDEGRYSVSDIWVLSSLMHTSGNSPWWTSTLVVPPNADWTMRARVRDLTFQAWPQPSLAQRETPAGSGVAVDAALWQQWSDAVERSLGQPVAPDETTIGWQAIASCWLNECAVYLMMGSTNQAIDALQRANELLGTETRQISSALAERGREYFAKHHAPAVIEQGQVSGEDGVWASAFEAANREPKERLNLLRSLRYTTGGDLGPIDAAMFANVVYRGRPDEARDLAQSIATDLFTRGPNVVMALLNQLPDAPRYEGVSGVVSGITGQSLPSTRSESWPQLARQAMVDHALRLLNPAVADADMCADLMRMAYQARVHALSRAESGRILAANPVTAAHALSAEWHSRAELYVVVNPMPDSLEGLVNRSQIRHRLAVGPLQHMVAAQVSCLEVMAYVAAAEQPILRAQLMALLADSSAQRSKSTNVMEQVLLAEQSILRLWEYRLVPRTQEDDA